MASPKIDNAKRIYELCKQLNETNKLIALGAVSMLGVIQSEKADKPKAS